MYPLIISSPSFLYYFFFFLNDPPTPEIYPLPLHDPLPILELGNGEAIKELVSAGLGPSITSAISVRAEARAGTLRVIPLSPPLVRRLGIIRRRDKPLSPPLQALLQALQRRARRRPARQRPPQLARGRR